MLQAVSWLVRSCAYVVIGIDVFAGGPLGPVALPVTTAAYALCGLLLAVWGLLDLRRQRSGAVAGEVTRTAVLGGIAVVSAVVAVQPGLTSLAALGTIAVLEMAVHSRRAAAWAVYGIAAAASLVASAVVGADTATLLGVPLLLVAGLLVGLNRRAYRAQAEQSAVLLAQAEQLRAEQRRGAVLDERARLAREIHDVLAHSLGALGIQIQAARALLTDHQDTGRAVEVLTVAQRMASDGLAETRRAVHALRSDTPPLTEELTRMAAIHEQRHGGTVRLTVAGEPLPLPPDQALALVRTAQESLTNAAKHAPRRPVAVGLEYGEETVTLTLANPLADGAPPPGAAFATVDGGYGLTGMRERLLLLGGTLTAGASGGTWTVTASVPANGRPTA
ncbi:sensor histidine kinase [Actinacidiphila guanduensis]|uniref:sensor histidine kinase n=1 Tax=Actinacidiphila guanduensis TaxID=310781 RepID=UPI000B8183FE|nr:histidine kinase [Actinacidiphila guanduensis]